MVILILLFYLILCPKGDIMKTNFLKIGYDPRTHKEKRKIKLIPVKPREVYVLTYGQEFWYKDDNGEVRKCTVASDVLRKSKKRASCTFRDGTSTFFRWNQKEMKKRLFHQFKKKVQP